MAAKELKWNNKKTILRSTGIALLSRTTWPLFHFLSCTFYLALSILHFLSCTFYLALSILHFLSCSSLSLLLYRVAFTYPYSMLLFVHICSKIMTQSQNKDLIRRFCVLLRHYSSQSLFLRIVASLLQSIRVCDIWVTLWNGFKPILKHKGTWPHSSLLW